MIGIERAIKITHTGSMVYLIRKENGILIHPYDDRGMDVICRQAAVLKTLYEKHNCYLLDYNREAMDRRFGPA